MCGSHCAQAAVKPFEPMLQAKVMSTLPPRAIAYLPRAEVRC